MKTRLLIALVGLAISFALPALAERKDAVAAPPITQKLLAIGKACDEGETITTQPRSPRSSPRTR
jgi:hypothetical protein